jgi:hypothetical protein
MLLLLSWQMLAAGLLVMVLQPKAAALAGTGASTPFATAAAGGTKRTGGCI